ncbi:hypothetical protein D3C84_599140 [compost metagenome]
MAGFGFTQQHGIERRCPPWQPQRYAHRHDQQWPQARVTGAVETAQVPEGQGAQGRVVSQVGEQTDPGTGHGGHRHARQEHGGDVGLAIPTAEAIHHCGDQQATGKGAHRQQVRFDCRWQPTHQAAADDGDGRTQCRAAGHADQARVGQGVAEQPLHGHPGQGQDRTDGDAEQTARQTNLPQDQLGLWRLAGLDWQAEQPQPGQQGITQRQADRPQGQGQPEHQQQQQTKGNQHHTWANHSRHRLISAVWPLASG